MADTGEGKKEEADYKRLHSFPLIRVRRKMSCVFTSVTDMQCYLCSSPPSKTRFLPLIAAVRTCTLAVPYRDFSQDSRGSSLATGAGRGGGGGVGEAALRSWPSFPPSGGCSLGSGAPRPGLWRAFPSHRSQAAPRPPPCPVEVQRARVAA